MQMPRWEALNATELLLAQRNAIGDENRVEYEETLGEIITRDGYIYIYIEREIH
jgi:hypothetical protein